MKFDSNHCIAIHVKDLAAAEQFYSNILKLELLTKTETFLEYDTGHFLLYINKGEEALGPIPSFNVEKVEEAKELLLKNGCTIIEDRISSLYFKDPFGNVYDIVED